MILPKNTAIKLIDVSFTAHPGINTPGQIILAHRECLGYAHFLSKLFDFIIIEHINYEGKETRNNIRYSFFKSRNKFLHIPLKTLSYIRKEQPDIVIVQGTVFPLQVILLRMLLGRKPQIIVQHHGNMPFKGIKKIFQQVADKCTNAYLFTALGNVKIWIDNNIIKNKEKCYEVLEGSTYLAKQNKQESRAILQMRNGDIFLWVGRLDTEKGPVTVLKGFEKYLHNDPGAKLYMIYQAEHLLPEVKTIINGSSLLKNAVTLVGKIPHEQLENWYSAADFYVSGSHREAAGFGLIESMACGCIPVVTDIPPFRKITGSYGFLFEKDNPDSLYSMLLQASKVQKYELSNSIVDYFQRELTFKDIADRILAIITAISAK